MIRHHPDDSLLLALAAGTLDGASALVIGAHAETCAACARSLAQLEAAGGALLDGIEPLAMETGAFNAVMARIDSAPPAARAVPPRARPDIPAGMHWPRSLGRVHVSPWKRIGPGMRWSRITVPGQARANAFLLRMAAGKKLALHTHEGRELTQILYGAFDDGRDTWSAGDLDEADETIRHRPIVGEHSECICLVAVSGRVRFDGFVAQALGNWMGI